MARADVGDTYCKAPLTVGMLEKIKSLGRIGRKRETMKCYAAGPTAYAAAPCPARIHSTGSRSPRTGRPHSSSY